LSTGGEIRSNSRPVLTAQFPDEPNGKFDPDHLYWRAMPMSFFSGNVWSVWEGDARIGDERRRIKYTMDQPGILSRTETGRGRPVKQVLFADNADPQGVVGLSFPMRVEAPGQAVSWSGRFDGSVVAREEARREFKYTVISEVDSASADTLRQCRDNYDDAVSPRVLSLLTHYELSSKTLDTVHRIVEGKQNVYDKALAIQEYLQSGQFFYTTTPPALPTDHPIDTFLNNTRIGHCELFASAMALMLRSQGVPARVARGYRGGEWNADDKTYTIRASMAHLWVEVYFMNYGWVTFDPSPVEEEVVDTSARWNWLAKTMSHYSMRSKILWYQYVIGYNPRRLMIDFNTWGARTLANVTSGGVDSSDGTALMKSPLGGVAMVAMECALGLGLVLLIWRRRAQGTGQVTLSPDQKRAIRLYRSLIRKAQRLGVDCRGKTAEELGRNFAEWGWLGAEDANAIIKLYSEARFGGKLLPPDEFATWRRALGRLRLSVPK
jgi:hypothetical protein